MNGLCPLANVSLVLPAGCCLIWIMMNSKLNFGMVEFKPCLILKQQSPTFPALQISGEGERGDGFVHTPVTQIEFHIYTLLLVARPGSQ